VPRIPPKRLLHLTAATAAVGAIFAYLQGSTRAICCADFDGYYHIRWSQLLWQGMRSGTFLPRFEWLPLTILNPREYVDHHFLFHVLQIPFTWSGDLRFGAKYAATVFATAALLACYGLIIRYRIAYAPLWLLALLASSSAFLYRMNMAKAPSVSLVLMVAGIYLLFEKRYLWLAPLAFIYVWTYSMFVMLGFAAAIWTCVIGWSERRLEWRPVIWAGLGTLAGFVINPYFPQNLSFFAHNLGIAVRGDEFQAGGGLEWSPFGTWTFLHLNTVASVAMVIGYIAFNPFDRKKSERALFFLILSTSLLVVTLNSLRWVEYWPPFATLFAAFSLQPIFNMQRGEDPKAVSRLRVARLACVTGALAIALYVTVLGTAKDIANDRSPEQYQLGMTWTSANVPPGEMIFNADWVDFPKLFYFDTRHRYVAGLGQTYLYYKDAELFNLYQQIRLGQKTNPAQLIRDRFESRYVFIDPRGPQGFLFQQLTNDPTVQLVFLDNYCALLRL
jgi:hypothetical protein